MENVSFINPDSYSGQQDFAIVGIGCGYGDSEAFNVSADVVSDSEVRLILPDKKGARFFRIQVNEEYLVSITYPDASYHPTDWFEL